MNIRLNHIECIPINCSFSIWIIELNFFMCIIQEFLIPASSEHVKSLCLVTHHFCISFIKTLVLLACGLYEHVTGQFISITKNPIGIGNVSNNKIPVKASKSHRRFRSACHKPPLTFNTHGILLFDVELQLTISFQRGKSKRKWEQALKFPYYYWESSL